MRYATIKDDPGFDNWEAALASNCIVVSYLNGVEQKHVSIADEEEGLIERCVLDADGRVQVDPKNPDQIWMETVRGHVRVEVCRRN
jgi:hypothetical protein